MEEIISKIEQYINEVSSKRYIELEFRIGKKYSSYFDTTIPKHFYDKILEVLDTMENCITETKEYTVEYDEQNRRKINDAVIDKKKINTIDSSLENSPFDVRFCISQEQPVKNFGSVKTVIKKQRKSYHYKNWNYDLTVSNGKYSIELELIIDKKNGDHEKLRNLIESTLLKIKDLSRICEPESIPEDYKLY